MKNLSLLILTLICTVNAMAQPWIGPVPGNIYYNQGNVGIGTTSPGSKLSVNATVADVGIYRPDNTTGYARTVYYTGTVPKWYLGMDKDVYPGADKFMIYGPFGIVATYDTNGNVGIGTTSPMGKLHVYGGSLTLESDKPIMFRRTWYGDTSGTAILGASGHKCTYLRSVDYDTPDGVDIEQFDGTSIAYFRQGGNVGIGTTEPTEKLHINGSNPKILLTSVSDNAYQAGLQTYWNAAHQMSLTGINGTEVLGQYIGNTALMYGNVGIGTTSPEAKLTVKGKIVASEIQVKDIGSIIPDYVFKPDYQLMSLSHVEEFVKLNQHLPEVPSEQEFKTNGMNMAEMNALLLKKIEELTLYVIDLKKENNAQNTAIELLKQKNSTK